MLGHRRRENKTDVAKWTFCSARGWLTWRNASRGEEHTEWTCEETKENGIQEEGWGSKETIVELKERTMKPTIREREKKKHKGFHGNRVEELIWLQDRARMIFQAKLILINMLHQRFFIPSHHEYQYCLVREKNENNFILGLSPQWQISLSVCILSFKWINKKPLNHYIIEKAPWKNIPKVLSRNGSTHYRFMTWNLLIVLF